MTRYAISTRPLGVVDGEFEDPEFDGCLVTFGSLDEAITTARRWPTKQFAVYQLDISIQQVYWEDTPDAKEEAEPPL